MNLKVLERFSAPPGIPADFRVNFMIIGTQKAGTSAVARLLSRHPDIYTSRRKELHFFDDMVPSGNVSYDRYHEEFRHYRGEKMVGEASPSYMYVPYVPAALEVYNPALKLIMILRHPVDRAFSQYNMVKRKRAEKLPFYEALLQEEERTAAWEGNYQSLTPARRYTYKRRGFYSTQIKNVRAHFPESQLLILKYDDFVRDYAGVLEQIYRFFEVESVHVENEVVNRQRYKQRMTTQEREYLLDYFASEVDELEKLLGWDLSAWRR